MRTSHMVLAAAGAAVVAATGSAFTASNTLSASVAGYGESSVTGTGVTDLDYVLVTADASRLDKIVFTTTENNSGRLAKVTLKLAGTQVGSPYACDTITSTTITCDLTDNPLLESFNSVGLTVVDNDA